MEPQVNLKENDSTHYKLENNNLFDVKEMEHNDTHSNESDFNAMVNSINKGKKSSTLFWLLPSISTFVGISTLLKSNIIWLGVTLGFFIATVNAYALYQHDKKKTCWTSSLLIILEVVGIMCLSYDAIQVFHKNVPASLPQPFDHYNSQIKMIVGIGMLSIAIFFSLILIYLANFKSLSFLSHQNNISEKKHTNKILYAQIIFTAIIVFMGTYPLMINFFTGLHKGIYTPWIIGLAISVALCSSTTQAFLIIAEKDKGNPDPKKKKRNLIIEWFGKFFMSVEIILSLANTAFSNHTSSFDECLQLLDNDWVDKNSHAIGLGLFIAAIILFIIVTYQHLKKISMTIELSKHNAKTDQEDCIKAESSKNLIITR